MPAEAAQLLVEASTMTEPLNLIMETLRIFAETRFEGRRDELIACDVPPTEATLLAETCVTL